MYFVHVISIVFLESSLKSQMLKVSFKHLTTLTLQVTIIKLINHLLYNEDFSVVFNRGLNISKNLEVPPFTITKLTTL